MSLIMVNCVKEDGATEWTMSVGGCWAVRDLQHGKWTPMNASSHQYHILILILDPFFYEVYLLFSLLSSARCI